VIFYAGYPKWMRPFLKRVAHSFGSPNYCTESSTCSKAAVLASQLNYGTVGRPQLSRTRCLLVWSNNPFYSNTSVVRNLLKARERGMRIIEVGPLITPLTAHADIHLRIRPGTSGALAMGMANVIIEKDLYDREFVQKHTLGFEEYRAYAGEFPLQVTENITGVPASWIEEAATLFGRSKPAAILSGANATVHHTNGVQNHRALTMLIGLTGNFDREGGNVVVPPGYLYVPNGLVTREKEFESSRPFEEMAPRIGEDAFPVWGRMVPEAQAMHIPFQIQSKRPYPLRAMIGFGLNHRMWPASESFAESLGRLDLLVDVDLFLTDSARMCDVILPACTSFERSELKFYAEQHVIWTTPAIEPLGESWPDTRILFELAKRIAPEDELMQRGYEACVDWMLEPTGLKVSELKKHPAGTSIANVPGPEYQKYEKSGFNTPSKKMEFTSTVLNESGFDPLPRFREPGLGPVSTPETAKDFPLILTTGARLPMFIHSQTFRLPWTRALRPDPMADINPADAEAREIGQGDDILLSTPRASIRVKANLTEIVPPGVVNMYHAYPDANVNELIEPDYLDPISGYPGFKSLLCKIDKV
jgi:anaerobic selenocysteine-containing dehydrogenase